MQSTWQGLGKMQFSKWQGLGNNYIVLHREEIPFELTAERVRLLCDRNLGIGSDGIMVIGAAPAQAPVPLPGAPQPAVLPAPPAPAVAPRRSSVGRPPSTLSR